MNNLIYICYENNSNGVNNIEPELRFGKKNFATQVISIAITTLFGSVIVGLAYIPVVRCLNDWCDLDRGTDPYIRTGFFPFLPNLG